MTIIKQVLQFEEYLKQKLVFSSFTNVKNNVSIDLKNIKSTINNENIGYIFILFSIFLHFVPF